MVMKRTYLYLLFHYTGKKDFQKSTAYVRTHPDVTFWTVGYHSPESQLVFHICYVKYENTLTCKRISWDSGGDDVLKIFFFYFLYV